MNQTQGLYNRGFIGTVLGYNNTIKVVLKKHSKTATVKVSKFPI